MCDLTTLRTDATKAAPRAECPDCGGSGKRHYDGQIGSEATPREYVAALMACTREWVRVLKPSGSLFVNLGDKYNASASGSHQGGAARREREVRGNKREARAALREIPEKCLLGLPWRYALGCIDDLGLILRAEIVWAKPNGLPESVTDRVRRSHEQVFHFTRQPRYFAAVDEVREAHAPGTAARYASGYKVPKRAADEMGLSGRGIFNGEPQAANPLGKLPGSVWEIPSAPLTVPAHLGIDHFAAYPPELVRRIILGWSPSGICTACGEGRRPVTRIDHERGWVRQTSGERNGNRHAGERIGQVVNNRQLATITGYACACPDATAPTRPSVVVDPFGGTGTTALVASVFGRTGVTVDRSADYCRLAAWRCSDPGERARALEVPKPPPVTDGQGTLFAV
jgi:hypothetical protein